MSSQVTPPSNKESKVSAGAAGVGGGTLLAVIATSLPNENRLKPFLIWAAPSVSVFLGGLWLTLQVRIANRLRDRELNQRIDSTMKMLEDKLKKADLEPSRRVEIKKQIEELEQINISRQMARIQSLKILSEEDIAGRA